MIVFRQIGFLLLTIVSVSGCGIVGGAFKDPFIDAATNKDGVRVVLDTPRMWNEWADRVDGIIRYEISGRMPRRMFNSWSDKWGFMMSTAVERRDNIENYRNYIIISRRVAGLPEFDFQVDLPEH